MNELLKLSQNEDIRGNLISRIRRIWPSVKSLFDTREISEIIGESPEFDDFIAEITSVAFVYADLKYNEIAFRRVDNLAEEVFDESSAIEFLNHGFVNYIKQQRLDFLENESLISVIRRDDFAYEKIHENVLMALLESLAESFDSEITEIVQKWLFDYISKNNKLPEYTNF